MFPVMSGLAMSRTGSRMPRTGSNMPQSFLGTFLGRICSSSASVDEPVALLFLPFFLPLTPEPPTAPLGRAFEETADFKLAKRSLQY